MVPRTPLHYLNPMTIGDGFLRPDLGLFGGNDSKIEISQILTVIDHKKNKYHSRYHSSMDGHKKVESDASKSLVVICSFVIGQSFSSRSPPCIRSSSTFSDVLKLSTPNASNATSTHTSHRITIFWRAKHTRRQRHQEAAIV